MSSRYSSVVIIAPGVPVVLEFINFADTYYEPCANSSLSQYMGYHSDEELYYYCC